MSTLLLTHPVCMKHDTGEHHPERAARLRKILSYLNREEFFLLHRDEAPMASHAQLELAHPTNYIEAVERAVPKVGEHLNAIDGDTIVSADTWEAALRSVGGACYGVDEVMAKKARNVFCATRPPGHHAETTKAMGFCFFNNAAIAAIHAVAKYPEVKKAAVIDFDVHHGNGTQDIFYNSPNLFYGSSHQSPGYPETGKESDTGVANNICNVELAPGSRPEEFRTAYEEKILPALRAFNPDFLVISAGFDAHARDPLAHLRLTVQDFIWVTEELLKVANECCQGRVVSVLEGGYDVDALAASVAAHVKTLMHA
ncbi:histone deacetylase family protein [Terasakiella sp.]|uniref:histone deacetylase family protein n=1 Tax=Terasakiella sp. TaxID=2034861 RepID=UPI003AA7E796